MNSSFYNGVNGMKTQQVGIDIWGHNIANGDTVGFKSQDVDFSTLFSTGLNSALGSPVTSDVGMSATSATSVMNLSQGSIQSTDSAFDMAINGKGWMAVKDQNGQTYYTRTGSFNKDADGTLVAPNGDKLQVVNAGNLTNTNGEWKFDSSIPTDNLISGTPTLSSIQLPDNITFPAKATKNISLAGNLPNEDIAPTPKPATIDNDFGVLYDADSKNMNLQDGQSIAFGFGDNISYSDGLVQYSMCIPDDEIDGNPVNIDFDVNGTNIKLEMPDGSKSKDISDAIAKQLDEKNILYEQIDGGIDIRADKNLAIKSNGGDLVTKNEEMADLVYHSSTNQTTDPTSFTTIKDFTSQLQTMADFSYGSNNVTVGMDDEGKIEIKNNIVDQNITAVSGVTDSSNDAFVQNLGRLGNVIRPYTSSSTLTYNQDYQGFTGNIIDSNGNMNDLKFDFYKTKIDGENTTWNLNITQTDADGKVVSTTNQDLKFDNIGALINPSTITTTNGLSIDLGGAFTGITSIDKDNIGFQYSQDGLSQGYLDSYDIGDNGDILASFSNGKTGILGQIPIYHFQNEQGLDSLSGNKYTVTNNSGEAFLYTNQDGSYLSGASIKNYSLESSNVDMGQAMTQLIIIQKAYEANSKSVTTSDQMVQKAIDMKR